MAYELFYWPTIQGRGEFVRLALEEAGAAYVDVARERGTDEMLSILGDAGQQHIPFAPPFLRHGKRLIGQTAVILQYLGDRHALAPKAEAGRLWTHQLQLTIADLVSEAHESTIRSALSSTIKIRSVRRRSAPSISARAEYLSSLIGSKRCLRAILVAGPISWAAVSPTRTSHYSRLLRGLLTRFPWP